MKDPLRKITGKRLRLLTVHVAAVWPRSAYHRRVREFQVFLECGHEANVPFGRRPQVGRRMRCAQCAEVNP